MATQKDLIEEIKGYGVELTGNESYNDLQKMAAKLRQRSNGDSNANANPNENSNDESGNQSQGGAPTPPNANNKPKGNAVYAWLKSQSYVDKDGTQRLDAGLYQLELSKYPRLKNISTVQIFEGEIPSMKLAEIARWCGVNPDAHRDNDELLEILVKEPKPFGFAK